MKYLFNKLTVIFLVFTCFYIFAEAQPKSGIKGKTAKDKSSEEEETRRSIREQAIILLRDCLINSRKIEDREQRAEIIADASIALWNYDKIFAQDRLISSIKSFLQDYETFIKKEKTNQSEGEKEELIYGINIQIKALAQKNLKQAIEFRKAFFSIKEKEISEISDNDYNEQFNLALETADIDIQASVSLISKIIDLGIPDAFPKFFFDLRTKNLDLADRLFQQAINNLSTKAFYSSKDVVLLSICAFNENTVIIPYFEANQTDNFYIYTKNITSKPTNFSLNNARILMQSYGRHLSLRLQNQANTNFNLPDNLLQTYFSVKKAEYYSKRLRIFPQNIWTDFQISVNALAQTSGISSKTLDDVSIFAERLVLSNNPLGLDAGKSAFEKAEGSTDSREKLTLLIEGIVQLIEARKFNEAEQKTDEISVEEVYESVKLLLNVRKILHYIENNQQAEFNLDINKIKDEKIKAFLYLKMLLTFRSKESDNFTYYFLEAKKNINATDDKIFQTSASFALTSFLLKNNYDEGIIYFSDALKYLNETPNFTRKKTEINIKIPLRENYFAEYLDTEGFSNSYKSIAQKDWLNSQILALQIKAPSLKIFAQIITAKTVLNEFR